MAGWNRHCGAPSRSAARQTGTRPQVHGGYSGFAISVSFHSYRARPLSSCVQVLGAWLAHRRTSSEVGEARPINPKYGWVANMTEQQAAVLLELPSSISIPSYGLVVVHAGACALHSGRARREGTLRCRCRVGGARRWEGPSAGHEVPCECREELFLARNSPAPERNEQLFLANSPSRVVVHRACCRLGPWCSAGAAGPVGHVQDAQPSASGRAAHH